jgi:TolA-binding protein
VCVVGAVALAECATASAADEPSIALTSTRAGGAAMVTPPVRTPTTADWDALNLGLAVDLWMKGDLRGAAQRLEAIDTSATSSFAQADRAAFLLAIIYLRLGDAEAFDRVAAHADAADGSLYRQWIRYAALVTASAGAPTSSTTTSSSTGTPPTSTGASPSMSGDVTSARVTLPGAEILAAALLLDMQRPEDAARVLQSSSPPASLSTIHVYLRATALEAAGKDDGDAWEELAGRGFRNTLEADLVATACLAVAAARMQRGEDPTSVLERVPRESRLAPRASHVLGLRALESGDTERAHTVLSELLRDYPTNERRRDVKLALGGLAMGREHFHAALRYFESAEDNWIDEYESFTRLEDEDGLAEAWAVWNGQLQWSREIRLSTEALAGELSRLEGFAFDLSREPALSPSENLADAFWPAGLAETAAPWDSTDALFRHSPQPEEWRALRAVQLDMRRALSAAAREEYAIAERKREIDRRVRFIQYGRDEAAQTASDLTHGVARLDSILTRLGPALVQLEVARDMTLAITAGRTRDMSERIARHNVFMDAMHHFYVNGPGRAEEFPPGVPRPAEVLSMEDTLGVDTGDFVTLFAQRYPALIHRSFTEIWRPRLGSKSLLLSHELRAELGRAHLAVARIDSVLASYAGDAELAAAEARRDAFASRADSLAQAKRELRAQIARAVAARARVHLEGERETVDYHIGDAYYELAVEFGAIEASDTTLNAAPYRDRAIGRAETFLKRYPQSIARGETRFRLADLRLAQARADFQIRMAEFLGERPSADDLGNRALAPFVNYGPAIELYEALLEEDRDFPHMDAVLFNLGMILSDDGQPAAMSHLERLVTEYPNSPHCQEAWLRMGSYHFERKDFAGSVALLERAAAGDNPSFAVIALYKLGWALFEDDRFIDAADAFRRLIDLYAAHDDIAATMDLRSEAEEYLVHALARSGGADAFRSYFDELGGRPYEQDILLALGHLMRSTSLYQEAAACDELWLSRYAMHPKSLAVAERLVETYRNWNKPDAARAAKLALAERFLPGSAWLRANSDPALQKSAEAFARSAYREAAAHEHEQARKTDHTGSWQSALTHYERYLHYWPDGEESARIHYVAGEAAFRLERYPAALSHFGAAARASADADAATPAMAADAAWQQVAVTDAWYRSSQRAGSDDRGADSLATRLLSTAGDFVGRHPQDKRSADVIWRVGNVAYSHGWYTEAAGSLAMLSERFPSDPRAVRAMRMSGDAHYRRADFQAAGAAYEKTVALAVAAGEDSVVTTLRATIPVCYFKHAESVAASDKKHGDASAASLFAAVAERWPGFAHADLAWYRAGLGYAARDKYADAINAWERLLAGYAKSDYARDSAVQIATLHEKSGDKKSAARAYERFSQLYRDDPDAPDALLKAADLLAAAGDTNGADEMRSLFVERFPGEVETVMEIRADRAALELARVATGQATLSSLMATPSPAGAVTGTPSNLQAYLALVAANPKLASPSIMAQVDFLKAEETYPAFATVRLTQPLPEAIERKKTKMEELLKLYERCSGHGMAEYARAAAHRIGQVLVEFGDALAASERPADLSADDLVAYDEVLRQQTFGFYDRGIEVWSNLLREIGDAPDDPGQWIARTRQSLWPRLSARFLYQPEVDYPLVIATPPKESD